MINEVLRNQIAAIGKSAGENFISSGKSVVNISKKSFLGNHKDDCVKIKQACIYVSDVVQIYLEFFERLEKAKNEKEAQKIIDKFLEHS